LLTGINNAAWFGYFAASRYWFALIPATSAALLGGCLGIMLNRRHTMTRRGWMTIGAGPSSLAWLPASIDVCWERPSPEPSSSRSSRP
jgi:hypothetical protein